MDRMSDKDGIFMGKFKGHYEGCRGGNRALNGIWQRKWKYLLEVIL